jgi:N-acetylneuraminic acid mutarotase
MGTARGQFTATLLSDGRVLVAGGYDVNFSALASAELYDPASGTWTATGSLAVARQGQTATLLSNGKVLVAGGLDSSFSPTSSAELYDPAAGTWSPAGTMAQARSDHRATLLANGKVLVVGGYDARERPIASAELYDPASNSWSTTGPMSTGRADPTATRLPDGRVLIAGGSSGPAGSEAVNSADIYDPTSGMFSFAAAMTDPRAQAAAAVLPDGRVLVTGGFEDNSEHNTAELYDPATGQWSSAGFMNRYRATWGIYQLGGLFALALPNGKVLVGGGDGQSTDPTTELYNPAAPAAPSSGSGSGSGAGTGSGSASGSGAGTGTGGAGTNSTRPVVTHYGLTNNPFVVAAGGTPLFGSAALVRRHKHGTTFTYTLSEAATVRIAISQRLPGRRRARSCAAPSRKLRHAKRCVRILPKGTLTRTSHQGANKIAFSGRLRATALKPGRYQATLIATDAAKHGSKKQTLYFRIVKR